MRQLHVLRKGFLAGLCVSLLVTAGCHSKMELGGKGLNDHAKQQSQIMAIKNMHIPQGAKERIIAGVGHSSSR